MAATTENSTGYATFTATAAAMDLGVRVKLDSSGNVSAAGVTDHWIGVTTHVVAASGKASIKLRGAPGTLLFKTAAAVTVGNRLYAAASGAVDDVQTGSPSTGYIAGSASGTAGDIIEGIPASPSSVPFRLQFPVALAGVTAADVVTAYPLDFAGTITAFRFITGTPVTTAAKLATFNIEIGTTNLTGGAIALTSALATPLGAIVEASAITAANTFASGDTLSIEAASVTAFAEGTGVLEISGFTN
jgi:hypothetical protein